MSKIKQLIQLREQGKGVKFIARTLGISKNTVKAYLEKVATSKLDVDALMKLEDPILEGEFHAGNPAYAGLFCTGTGAARYIKINAIPRAVKLSKSAVAYAAGKKDIALEMSVKLTKSGLERLKENTLLTTLLKFYNLILPVKAQLEHLNPTDVADFGVMIENLKKAIPQPQVEMDESKTATYNLGSLIIELNAMFKELDKFIDPFEYTHPNFYRDYMNSRVVKDLKKKSTSKSKKAIPSKEA